MLRKIILLVFILIALLIVAVVTAALLIDPDDYREQLAARASEQLGREVRLEGPMELTFFPWLALDIRDVTVDNQSEFEQAPSLASIERASASVRVLPLLRGEIEIGTVTIGQADLNVVTGRDGSSNLDGLFAGSETAPDSNEPTDLSQIRTGGVQFRNVVLNLIDLAADSRTELHLDSLSLDSFAAGADLPLSLDGRLVEGGEAVVTLALDGTVRVAADLAQVALSDWSLRYTLLAAGAEGEAEGSLVVEPLADPLRIELTSFANRVEMGELNAELSAEQAITATIGEVVRASLPAARLTLNGQALNLDGEATVGERIGGRLNVTGERLDLTTLVPEGGQGSGDAGDDADGGPAQDFSALDMFDLDFSLELGELVMAEGARLTDVTARSRLSGGELTLDPLSARLFGGQFEGSARVDFTQQPPEVVLSPNLSGVRVAELASLFTSQSPVDGQGEFTMDVRFSGFSPEQMLASLAGNGNFAIADGVLQGVDLRALIEQELTTDNLGNIARTFGGETRFRTLDGGLTIEDGVVELPDLNLAAAGYAATGQGRIDLGANRVDYVLALDLGEELTQQLPRALRRATNGRIPLGISGELTAPTVSVDLAALAEGAVREELGRRLLEALDDDDEGESEEESAETQEEGEPAQEGAEPDEGERRREAGRNLLRGLLEKQEKDEEPEEDPEVDESQEETESDPPPAGGV
ncbi:MULTISPECIES: AsmA family protein [unclassified Wenzhouxiangella]|uniref:AsmA family protein n=1 Tax=unclassified Wenzhouxiangella TaxID=2613841 RepID=UPI000E326E50|nr:MULTISPECIES: AsmA family protein [unclassified Wenzhouxiangella]RFF27436.1 AsmA family protein [Wenzhouxiangella sp. 15181]RFP68864.1 AsmA family protein [Wenzhouxiangella sp. 15190]